MKGFHHVFSFTFRCQTSSKGYRISTIVMALLLFLLPAVILPVSEKISMRDEAVGLPAETGESEAEPQLWQTSVRTVYTVDLSEGEPFSLDFMNTGGEDGEKASFVQSDDLETVKASLGKDSLAVVLEYDETTGYEVNVVAASDDEDVMASARIFNWELQNCLPVILLEKAGFRDPAELDAALDSIREYQEAAVLEEERLAEEAAEEGEGSGQSYIAQTVLSYILPYLTVMILYFMVLYYGQGVANTVVMEKSSKLMDMFLIAVRPWQMIFGKVLAIVTSSILQFGIWLVSLFAGFAAGSFLVKQINPETDSMVVKVVANLPKYFGPDIIPALILSVLIVCGGFLLYCTLASIGGALAGKQEDLGVTNSIFSMVLVVSFLLVFFGGGIEIMGEGNSTVSTVLNWVPFTSIMILPSRLVLGQASIMTGLAALGIILVTCVVFMLAAGKLYRMMSFYRGKIPSPAEIMGMLRSKEKSA